jgi:two-component system, response regulator YesN
MKWGRRPLKVIIADDEPIVLEGLRWLIDWNSLGFELVGEAYDGEDALKLMEDCRPDLVITDIRMPVIDGLSLIGLASERYPLTQFIILSGYADFEYARQAIRHGVSYYLTKPLDDRELECAVKAAASTIRSKEAKLRRQQTAARHIREETVIRLLLGETQEAWVASARAHLNLSDPSRVRCIQLLTGHEEEQPRTDCFIERTAHDTALAGVRLIPYRISKDNQGLLLISDSAGPGLSKDLVNGLIASFRLDGGEKWSYAVSSEHRGPPGLHRAYQEAVTAGICKPSSEEKGVYFFQDMLLEHASLIPDELTDLILKAVADGDPDGVRRFSRALSAVLPLDQAVDSWAGAYLSTVRLEALKVLMEHGADVNEWTKRWFSTASQHDPEGLLYRWIKDLMEAAVWITEGSGTRTDAAVHEAVEYIKLHYQNKLKLQQVAGHVHLNPAYLGQRFKKQLGVAFNEYLHSVRTEEAKKLLRRTDLKITDIAARVGYPDAEQFAAKFKAVTGMLPSAYKKGC